MNLIEVIPIGKEHKKTRQELMYKAKITDTTRFRKELAKLRKEYIIVFDEGYYLPSSKEEYLEIIKKLNGQVYDATKTIELAYKEMEGMYNT